MKIGIITFWDSQDNYGQLLQCYALQRFLKNNGHQPILIKYKIESIKEPTIKKMFRKSKALLSPKHIRSYVNYRNSKLSNTLSYDDKYEFNDFRRKYIESTETEYYSLGELWAESWDIDYFICGSDQIWSPRDTRILRAFFLDFIPSNKQKIAYAASFGRSELPKYYQDQLYGLLKSFNAVSLREQGGVEICEKVGYNNCKLVSDPTMLLEQNDYIDLSKESQSIRNIENLAMIYLINWDTNISMNEIDRHVKVNGLRLKYYAAHGAEDNYKSETAVESDCTIPSWLNSISQAKIVFTNSFHGTLLSIIHHTPFVVFLLSEHSEQMNGRIISILTKLNLLNRIYDGTKSLDDIINNPIDWCAVDKLKESFREDSSKWLLQSINKRTVSAQVTTVCFMTRGSVHHYYGGLDRVTEILADYLESQGYRVLYLSQVKRNIDNPARQHYLVDRKRLKSTENEMFFNRFLKTENIDVIINQEGNVDLTIPIHDRSKVKVLTALHFNPIYITDDHFAFKYKNSTSPIGRIMGKLLKIEFVKQLGLSYLHNKLARNYRYQCSYADHFILLSDRFRKDMHKLLKDETPANVIAINNPIVLNNDYLQELSIKNKSKTLLYVGRIEFSQKRVDIIVKIWSRIADKYSDWNLKVIGDGPDKSKLEQLISSNKIARVSVLGNQDPTHYYKESSVFCFASSFEGWGMVLIEAQSMGCVPIAFNSYSSLADIIEDQQTGVVVDNSDINQYEEKLTMLMDDNSLRHKMALNCRESVKKYDISHIGEQWIELINK